MSGYVNGENGIWENPPPGYVLPSWPSLYKPTGNPIYLYDPYPIWKFTLLWTLLFFGIISLIGGLLTVPALSKRHWRLTIIVPLVFVTVGLLEAFIMSTIVGYILAALYDAAYFRMSTFIPALWGAFQALMIVFYAFSKSHEML